MVLGKDIDVRILCLSDTRDLETQINELLKANPNKTIILPPLQIAERYARGTEAKCPRCNEEIKQTTSQTLPYSCSGCKRTYTQSDVERLTKTTYTRAGNFFIQTVILENDDQDDSGPGTADPNLRASQNRRG